MRPQKYTFEFKLECVERCKQAIAECFGCPAFPIQDFFDGEKKMLLALPKRFSVIE